MLVDLTDERYLKDLREDLRIKFKDDDLTMTFLEEFCNFTKPMNIFEPEQLIYETAKRDVLLTLKTLIDNRLSNKEVAQYYTNLKE